MFKLTLLLAIVVCSNAQLLTSSPLILGSNKAAAQQIIRLQRTPLGLVRGAPLVRQLAIAPQRLAIAPQYIAPQYLAPQIIAKTLIADEAPEPYTYAFQSVDEYGTTLNRQESADGSGAVTGSYGYTDAQGLQRIVEYIADDAGYRASVKTNEPGTANANPANVLMISTAN